LSITTYSGLLTELLRLIDGEDVEGSEIPVATLAQVVHLGELRIYREARTRFNQKAFTAVTVTSNLAPIPADFISTSIIHFGNLPLIPKSEHEILEYLEVNPGGTIERYFCDAGDNFQFAPSVANGTAVQGRYYYKMPDLDETTLPTNALFAVAEDLYLYGALSKSAPFFGQDRRIPVWEAEYQRILTEMNVLSHRSAYSAGRMMRSPGTRATP
jgi:hypothetical protein